MKTLILVLGVVLAIVLSVIGLVVSANNTAVRYENALTASYEDMENILGQYSLKVKEVAQVPDMAIDGLKQVMQAAMSGRYGSNGSQATFQWIKENYPGQVDSALYGKIQQIVEAGRNKFENSQTAMIDKKAAYKIALGSFPSGFVMKFLGFPKIDLEKYKIISSGHAQEAFKTGVDTEIKLK